MNRTYEIPASNLATLQRRIDDLARRADKIAARGELADATPIDLLVLERFTKPEPGDETGLRKRVYYRVEVTGSTPKLAGWEFVATLQHTEAGNLVRSIPDVSLPVEFRTVAPTCDHCKVDRRRNDTFVLRHGDGTLRQVGRNCLRDFLGGLSPTMAASMAELLIAAGHAAEECGDEGSGGGEYVEDLPSFLAYAACAIRLAGWTSRTTARDSSTRQATADAAWGWMHPSPGARDVPKPEPRDAELAERALAWTAETLGAQDPLALGDYEHNLRVAIVGGVVTHRLAGIVASIVPYYERAMGREVVRAKAKAAGYVGEVGKRVEWELELAQVFSVETMWGAQHIHKFYTVGAEGIPAGASVVWKTGSDKYEPGVYRVRGTVKKHAEFRGEMQTELARCKMTRVEDTERKGA